MVTMMTDLSPAAQAVYDAYCEQADNPCYYERSGLVAALRAAAQTLAYEIHCPGEGWYELVLDAKDVYAIATELESADAG